MLIIIFWKFIIFEFMLNLSQIKLNLISSIIKFVNELPHALQNELRFKILGY